MTNIYISHCSVSVQMSICTCIHMSRANRANKFGRITRRQMGILGLAAWLQGVGRQKFHVCCAHSNTLTATKSGMVVHQEGNFL